MTLVAKAELKEYLRIQGTAEDTLLDALIARAIGMVEAFVRRPIEAEERTFVMGRPSEYATAAIRAIHVPIYPVAVADSSISGLTLTDDEGDTLVEDSDYRLDVRTGRITGINGAFATWPYTIVATVGLSAHPNYTDRIEPVMNVAIIDIAADLYQRRSPAATSESTGGGVSSSYVGGIPERVKDMLRPFVMARAL
jgi:hypothetical protein